MAWKQKPQSAFLAICPSMNIAFRDNRQKCRHYILSLIHCTGRSELLKYLNDLTNTRYSLSFLTNGLKKPSKNYISGFTTKLLHKIELVSQFFQKLWQKRYKYALEMLMHYDMGRTKKIFTLLNLILHSVRKHCPVFILFCL